MKLKTKKVKSEYGVFEKKTLAMFQEYLNWQVANGVVEHNRTNVRQFFIDTGKRNIDLLFYYKGLMSLNRKIKKNLLSNEELILCQTLSQALEKK